MDASQTGLAPWTKRPRVSQQMRNVMLLKVLKLKRARINARFLINKRRLGGPRPSCHPLAPVPSPFRGASMSRGVTATGAVLPAST